jgi:competence protein ComEC
MAIASGEIVAAPRRHVRPFAALVDAFSAEGERRAHWLPVFLGAGITAYFALTVEPPWWVGPAALLAAMAMVIALRRVRIARVLAVLLALIAAGFALIQFAAWRDGTKMLDHRLGSVALTGRVIEVDQRERGWRVIIVPDPLPGLALDEQPRRVRVSIPPGSDLVQPGDHIACAHGCTRRRRRSCRAAGICSAHCISPGSARSATVSARPAGSTSRARRAAFPGATGCNGCATR